jgi:uncharacterized protein YegL
MSLLDAVSKKGPANAELPADAAGPFVQLNIIADGSDSMRGVIDEVNDGLRSLAVSLAEDDLARNRVDVTVIRFGGVAEQITGPVLARDFNAPTISVGGLTPMGGAVNLSLDSMEARRAEYRTNGVREYVPWIILFTDGYPTDNTDLARQRVHELTEKRRLNFFGLGTSSADMETLAELCPNDRPPRQIRDGRWEDMFEWVSLNVSSASRATPGTSSPLAPASGWSDAWS